MLEEFQAFQKLETWVFVPLLTYAQVLGSKWVYKIKSNFDGTFAVTKHNWLLKEIRKGPVAKMPTVHILLTIIVHHTWEVHQLDISNSFLHGSIDTTVYIKQPPGFVDSHNTNHIFLFRKAIY